MEKYDDEKIRISLDKTKIELPQIIDESKIRTKNEVDYLEKINYMYMKKPKKKKSRRYNNETEKDYDDDNDYEDSDDQIRVKEEDPSKIKLMQKIKRYNMHKKMFQNKVDIWDVKGNKRKNYFNMIYNTQCNYQCNNTVSTINNTTSNRITTNNNYNSTYLMTNGTNYSTAANKTNSTSNRKITLNHLYSNKFPINRQSRNEHKVTASTLARNNMSQNINNHNKSYSIVKNSFDKTSFSKYRELRKKNPTMNMEEIINAQCKDMLTDLLGNYKTIYDEGEYQTIEIDNIIKNIESTNKDKKKNALDLNNQKKDLEDLDSIRVKRNFLSDPKMKAIIESHEIALLSEKISSLNSKFAYDAQEVIKKLFRYYDANHKRYQSKNIVLQRNKNIKNLRKFMDRNIHANIICKNKLNFYNEKNSKLDHPFVKPADNDKSFKNNNDDNGFYY